MRRKFVFIFTCAIALLLSSCQDDVPSGERPSITDDYYGSFSDITLGNAMNNFHCPSYELFIKTETGEIISRKGDHLRFEGTSHLNLKSGLKPGNYQLLYLSYPSPKDSTKMEEYGLGCNITISHQDSMKIKEKYSELFGMFGSGTASDPFIVTSYDHLKKLRKITNDHIKNKLLQPQTYFRQDQDIDLDYGSWSSDNNCGWLPIGDTPNNPFRGIYDGNGYRIKNLWMKRNNSGGLGLFGYADEAVLANICMKNPQIEGSFAVGTVLGAAVTKGNKRTKTWIRQCTTDDGSVSGNAGSAAIGGIIGLIDMEAVATIDSCYNHSTVVKGAYGVGGVLGVGATYSTALIQGCKNYTDITSGYSGCGGIIGTCDSLMIINSYNAGKITGASEYKSNDTQNGCISAGGIAGGAGMSHIYTCINEGEVTGNTGVGGLVGSTCISKSEQFYNTSEFRSCYNTANISGQTAVGGILGEGQLGTYLVYNTGKITALGSKSIAGGIAGNTSIAVIHNTINAGDVTDTDADCTGGVVGKSTWLTAFAAQNIATVNTCADNCGGIAGLAGTQSIVNYCCNAGHIINTGTGYTGGVIGQMGDPREWSALNTINCVIGGIEIALGFIGPAIALTAEAAEKSTEAIFTSYVTWKRIHKIAHVSEVVVDIITLATEGMLKVYTGIELFGHGHAIEVNEDEIKENSIQINNKVVTKIAELRAEMKPSGLYEELKVETATEYLGHLNELIAFYEADEEHISRINMNINYDRESRAEEVEEVKHTREVVHWAIGTISFVVSTTAFLTSAVATGGATLAIGAAWVASLSSFVGGANAIIETVNDYQPNVASISQCVNMGGISAGSSKKTAGILGVAWDFAQVKDCINMGDCEIQQGTQAGITCCDGKHIEVHRCLTIGKHWSQPVCSIDYGTGLNSLRLYHLWPLYYYSYEANSAPMDYFNSVYLAEKYLDWDINGENSLWHVTEEEHYFPMPKRSKMQAEIKKNE